MCCLFKCSSVALAMSSTVVTDRYTVSACVASLLTFHDDGFVTGAYIDVEVLTLTDYLTCKIFTTKTKHCDHIITLVERLCKKIIHFLIKAPNSVQHLLNLYYFILDTMPFKLPIISRSKNLKNNRKCIGKAIKVH